MADQNQPGTAVYRSDVEAHCRENALVLRAVGVDCVVRPDPQGYVLIVRDEDTDRAQAELDAYAQENEEAILPDFSRFARTDGWSGVCGYVTVILIVAICKDRSVFSIDWLGAGKTSAALIRQGEWWRTVTALTLHADPAHLIANALVGGLFGLFAARQLGSGSAWLSILVGGAAGNAINAWLRPDWHTSVGASTAVFAALGILAAYAWTQRRSGHGFSFARWTPLVGGVVLLGYLGVGGARTDVLAHVAGFASGLMLGGLYGVLGARMRLVKDQQAWLGTAAIVMICLAWGMALTRAGG